MKISIVTICYNEAANIAATMESVFAQTYRNIEYVVQDGGSTDGTVEKIREFADKVEKIGGGGEERKTGRSSTSTSSFNFVWESARDGGLYNGMNAGLAKCTGDYVLFCNAGDRLASNDVIEKLASATGNWQNRPDPLCQLSDYPDLVYGDCEDILGGQHLIRTAHGPHFMKCGMPASHEAMLYKLSLIRQLGLKYDPSYRIAADYKLTYQFVNAAKAFAYVPIPVVVFSEGGVSTANKWKGLMECNRARKEVSGLSLPSRLGIILMQCVALFLSTYCAPVYRLIRLRKAKSTTSNSTSSLLPPTARTSAPSRL